MSYLYFFLSAISLVESISVQERVEDVSENYSLIALQGPKSREILSKFTDVNLKMPFYSYEDGIVCGYSVMVSRTGYTGELGFEIYGDKNSIISIWNELVNAGAKPAGLAARDILRMEMKYCLYGNDIDDTTNPIEAGLSWVISLDKEEFIGKDALGICRLAGKKQPWKEVQQRQHPKRSKSSCSW